jgi:DNA (cytosine-5)-methyltransferase 1
MKLVDLFCGCGGFSLGAHKAGFEVAATYDIDPILTQSFPQNFPNTKLFHRDVAVLTGPEIERDIGEKPFGIFGGPPCQGFSSIGLRAPDDQRRDLLFHFFRIVSEVLPTFFVMENVRGLIEPRNSTLLDRALALVRDAYDLTGPLVLDAADYGAATIRRRVVVIGILKGNAQALSEDDLISAQKPAWTVKAAIADLQRARELPCVGDFDRWKISTPGRANAYARRLRSEDGTFTGNMRTQHTYEVLRRFSKLPQGGFDPVGRYPRLTWGGLCPTLRAGTGSDRGSFQSVRPVHPEEDRVITVREAARLQGFPDSHLFHPTIWHSFRMIGNSVSPLMSEAIFAIIRKRLALNAATKEPLNSEPPLSRGKAQELAEAAE